MNNFLTRTLYGFIFAIVMIGAILLDVKLLALLLLLITFIGTKEMVFLFKKTKYKQGDKFLFQLIGLFFYSWLAAAALGWNEPKTLFLFLPLLSFPFLHALFSKKHTFSEVATLHWATVFYVAIPSGLMLFFYNTEVVGPMAGALLLLTVIGFVWINDIFAYLVGIKLGRTKLFERISPKKSREGSLGGLVFTLGAAYVLSLFAEWITTRDAMMIALIVVVTGSLGDLVESMLKRQANVKDSGNILPGHGGVLDRFDATFFAVPFVFVYLVMTQ